MPFREPSWWYQPAPNLTARLLSPAAFLYGAISARRMHRGSVAACSVPVVCIGNFTAGGTGKTPLALLLAERLRRQGLAPVILTRGYGSGVRAPTLVDLARHGSSDVGDEALLLARAAPVMVAPDRAAGAQAIADSALKADLILMDDGLQNPSIAKDVRIAVVDGDRGFGNGLVIPAGPLRAPLSVQSAAADVVVVNGRREDGDRIARVLGPSVSAPILTAHQEPAADKAWLNGTRVVAFAGIGNPARFYRLLERLGAQIAGQHSFPDHHAFTEEDAARLLSDANRLGARLVTTEKDLVRLTGQTGARGDLARQSQPLAIAMVFDGDGEERLLSLITDALKTRSRG